MVILATLMVFFYCIFEFCTFKTSMISQRCKFALILQNTERSIIILFWTANKSNETVVREADTTRSLISRILEYINARHPFLAM